MSIIKLVKPLPQYSIKTKLDNGNEIITNFDKKMTTIRFCQLRDQNIFKAVKTDGYCIYWDNIVEVSLTELIAITFDLEE